MDKPTVIVIVSIMLVGIFIGGAFSYFNNHDDNEYLEPNYSGLAKLGLVPNSEPRWATDKDIYTGLRIEYQEQHFGLFESRTWEEGDYGKTFISPIINKN